MSIYLIFQLINLLFFPKVINTKKLITANNEPIKKTKIAIVGIQGLPAKYGGYETLVDYLSEYNDSNKIDLLIYCSKKYYKKAQTLTKLYRICCKW